MKDIGRSEVVKTENSKQLKISNDVKSKLGTRAAHKTEKDLLHSSPTAVPQKSPEPQTRHSSNGSRHNAHFSPWLTCGQAVPMPDSTAESTSLPLSPARPHTDSLSRSTRTRVSSETSRLVNSSKDCGSGPEALLWLSTPYKAQQ